MRSTWWRASAAGLEEQEVAGEAVPAVCVHLLDKGARPVNPKHQSAKAWVRAAGPEGPRVVPGHPAVPALADVGQLLLAQVHHCGERLQEFGWRQEVLSVHISLQGACSQDGCTREPEKSFCIRASSGWLGAWACSTAMAWRRSGSASSWRLSASRMKASELSISA